MNKALVSALLVAGIIASPVSAAVVFQSIPDLTAVPVVAGYCSSCNQFLQFRIFDRFTLGEAASITSVTFALDTGTGTGNSVNPVNVGFFNVAGAVPGSAIASYDFSPADFDTVQDFFGDSRNRALITVSLPELTLQSGSYYISFFNAMGLSVPAYANPGGALYQSGNFFQPAQTYADRSAAFSLSNDLGAAVPEPESWAMMIVGFGLVGAAARRRSARVTA